MNKYVVKCQLVVDSSKPLTLSEMHDKLHEYLSVITYSDRKGTFNARHNATFNLKEISSNDYSKWLES